MNWDYRALCPWIDWVEEGQGSEGGTNQYDNCVPAATLLCLEMLYRADLAEPQDITSAEYGAAYHGVEDFGTVWQYVTGHPEKWPNPPAIAGYVGADMATWIEEQGAQSLPMIYYVHCDAQANIVAGGAFGHAAVPIAGDGSSIVLWGHGFYGGTVTLSHADINAVSFGGATVLERPIPQEVHMLTPSEKREKVRTWFIAGLGREPEETALDAYAGAIADDGSNCEALAIQIYDSGEGQAWRAHLAATGQPGPPGAPGAGLAPGSQLNATITIK